MLVDATQPGAQNLLGMDVLKGHCCHFLFDSETLVVEATREVDGMRPLQMDDVSHPYVEVSWANVTAYSVWDSGSGITIVDQAFWLKHPDLFEEAGTSVGTDATGNQVETPTFVMAEAEIGGNVCPAQSRRGGPVAGQRHPGPAHGPNPGLRHLAASQLAPRLSGQTMGHHPASLLTCRGAATRARASFRPFVTQDRWRRPGVRNGIHHWS